MFLKGETEDEFENLEGDDQNNKVNTLGDWPNCSLAHPNLFNQLNSKRQVNASIAAIILI
jgi:hypothetical protein